MLLPQVATYAPNTVCFQKVERPGSLGYCTKCRVYLSSTTAPIPPKRSPQSIFNRPSIDYHAGSLNAGSLTICLMTASIKPGNRASNSVRRSEF
jgi:hypothetical protein